MDMEKVRVRKVGDMWRDIVISLSYALEYFVIVLVRSSRPRPHPRQHLVAYKG